MLPGLPGPDSACGCGWSHATATVPAFTAHRPLSCSITHFTVPDCSPQVPTQGRGSLMATPRPLTSQAMPASSTQEPCYGSSLPRMSWCDGNCLQRGSTCSSCSRQQQQEAQQHALQQAYRQLVAELADVRARAVRDAAEAERKLIVCSGWVDDGNQMMKVCCGCMHTQLCHAVAVWCRACVPLPSPCLPRYCADVSHAAGAVPAQGPGCCTGDRQLGAGELLKSAAV